MRNDCNLELRSPEVQEIMGRIPSLIERLGIFVLFAFVIASLSFCAFVKYPEQLEMKASRCTIKKKDGKNGCCAITYLCDVGLDDKSKIRKSMEASVKLGTNHFPGKVSFVSSNFDTQTGLFHVYIRTLIDKDKMPLVIQYQYATTVSVNVASQSVLQKIFQR